MIHDVVNFAGAHARVQRNEGVTSARQASSKLHVFAAVAEQNRNRRLVGKSHAGDEVGHLVGARIKFGVGPGAVAIDDRGGLGLGNGEFAYAVSDVERIATRKQRHSSSKRPLQVSGHPAPARSQPTTRVSLVSGGRSHGFRQHGSG
ncbi:unannotated protein [freshwater metagenome]|uniref:Unannotated protein n=1 Tax=freshwater metagenome TaxID=449393 RepID=A0A6J6W4L0_9ZZZZ